MKPAQCPGNCELRRHTGRCRQRSGNGATLADSGNGYHLLYFIDLPADDGGLVQRVLHALADKFDDEDAEVDRSVSNPSRIARFYGTQACKGDETPERPHRWSGLLEAPEQPEIVSRDLLSALASIAKPSEASAPVTRTETSLTGSRVHERARAYLEKLPPAIAGSGGHNQTFRAACILVKDFALPVDDALPLLKIYNEKCQPPWTESELIHKLQDAAKTDGPPGRLLGSTRDEKQQASGFQLEIMDSAALDAAPSEFTWLVKKVLVARQPTIIGGPKKVLKTSVLIDLGVSLATATHFLQRFEVPPASGCSFPGARSTTLILASTSSGSRSAAAPAIPACMAWT
jgi:hypothetical protein